MRQILRALAVIAGMVSVVSCAEPTRTAPLGGPSMNFVRLSFAPSWSPAAAEAYGALSRLAVDITTARIRLTSSTGAVVVDTTIAFPVTRDTLAVQINVRVVGSQQTFEASLELRDASGAVQFASYGQVVARTGDAGNAPVLTELAFVGPGAAARTISVSPSAGTVAPGASEELVATALDAAGRNVSGLTVRWITSDASIATITPSGSATASARATGRRGVVTFTATGPTGISGTAQLTFLPTPGRLAVLSGGGQSAGGGQQLPAPFVVELTGVDGLPIANQLITFRPLTAGGRVGSSQASTDVLGRASTSLTTGSSAGAYQFSAEFGGLSSSPISVTATTQIAPIFFLLPITPLPSQIIVGIAPPEFSAQLSDAAGNPVRAGGVRCTLSAIVSPGGGAFSVSAISDANGIVRVAIPAYQGAPGDAVITLTVEGVGVVASVAIKVVPRP